MSTIQRGFGALVQGEVYVDNPTAPVNAPFHITPSSAPTNGVKGDAYLDTNGILYVHDGTAYRAQANAVGGARTVKTGAATLTALESGALCIFNAAAGFLYTLPPAAAGLWYEFVVQTTATSLVHRVACASGDFLLGTILQGSDGTYVTVARTADGATHLAWEGNGSTTGGIIGDHFWVTAISASQWEIYGYNSATGAEATPFKTS